MALDNERASWQHPITVLLLYPDAPAAFARYEIHPAIRGFPRDSRLRPALGLASVSEGEGSQTSEPAAPARRLEETSEQCRKTRRLFYPYEA